MLSNFFGATKSQPPTTDRTVPISKRPSVGTHHVSDTMKSPQQATVQTLTANVGQKDTVAETSRVSEGLEAGSFDFHDNYPLIGAGQYALSDANNSSFDDSSANVTQLPDLPIQDGNQDYIARAVPMRSSNHDSMLTNNSINADESGVHNIDHLSTNQPSSGQQLPMATPPSLPNTDSFVFDSADRVLQEVDMVGATQSTGLTRYRPVTELPQLQGRKCKTPPPVGSGWSVSPTWPPPKPYRGMPPVRPDVVPPEGSPLHVHIQAYALRWGTWATQIKDDTLREQMLKWVTDKMREAWETAIKEGYYPRPDGMLGQTDHARSGSDGQTKQRGRKRAQSPSKQPAPFAHEGKDALAVTNGELATIGITMEMINDRVVAKDFEAGELLLDEVLSSLGKDKIEVRDWCRTYRPSVPGRNLLMYSLYAVQEARSEVQKLRRLYTYFTKDIQKKNTQIRIDTYNERAQQFLALATEIQLSRLEDGGSDACTQPGDIEEVQQVNLTSDSSSVEVVDEEEQSADDTPGLSKNAVIEIARDVLLATDEHALVTSLASRGLQAEDFSLEAGQDGLDPKTQEARQLLAQIHKFVTQVVRVRQAMSKTHLPGDKIKFGHDARLMKEKIGIARGKLRILLAAELGLHTQPATAGSQPVPVPNAPNFYQPGTDEHDASPTHDVAPDFVDLPPPMTSIPGPSQTSTSHGQMEPTSATPPQPVQSLLSMPEHQTTNVVPAAQLQEPNLPMQTPTKLEKGACPEGAAQGNVQDSTAKQAYIDQHYLPWLNEKLAKRQLSPIQGSLSGWQDIKGHLTQLKFGSKDRNVELRKFKAGFEEWCAKNKGSFSQSGPCQPSQSQLPAFVMPTTSGLTTNTSPSGTLAPMLNYAELGRPSDAEILTAIPPTGIHSSILGKMFIQRFGGDIRALRDTIRRLAFVGAENMIYPPRPQPTQPHAQTQSSQQPTMSMNGHHFMPNRSQFSQYNVMPPRMAPSQSKMPNQPMTLPLPSPLPTQHLHLTPTPLPLSATTNMPTSPHQVVTLKLNNHGFNQFTDNASPSTQDRSPIAPDYSSHEVNSSRGFTFRHLPNATLEQRKRMDDHVNGYIAQTIKSKRRRHGQYVTLTDPEDPQGPPVMHGIWDVNNKGTRPTDVDWFYNGGDIPADWAVENAATVNDVQIQGDDGDWAEQAQQQKRPKLRLSVKSQSQGHQSFPGHMQGQDTGTARKRGTKRPRTNTRHSRRKKKQRTAGGDDDDGDYDPGQDY